MLFLCVYTHRVAESIEWLIVDLRSIQSPVYIISLSLNVINTHIELTLDQTLLLLFFVTSVPLPLIRKISSRLWASVCCYCVCNSSFLSFLSISFFFMLFDREDPFIFGVWILFSSSIYDGDIFFF